MRDVVRGKRWLLLSRWIHLTTGKRQESNQLFTLNRKVFKAYILKESLDRLWTYRYEGAMLNYLQRWIRSAPVAAPEAIPETGADAAGSPGRHSELLQDEGAPGGRGSREREYQITPSPRARIQKPALSAPKVPAHGRDQDRIRGFQESSLKCRSHRIPAESQKY
jgi:hypothetical protein